MHRHRSVRILVINSADFLWARGARAAVGLQRDLLQHFRVLNAWDRLPLQRRIDQSDIV